MDFQEELLAVKQLLEREKQARIQAEQLLEAKAAELYAATQLLEAKVTERTDAVEKKNRELQLTTSRLELLSKHLPFGILLEDEFRQVVMVNNAFCTIFEIPVEAASLIGADCALMSEKAKFDFSDPGLFTERIRELLENRQLCVNEELFLKNGKVLQRDFIPVWNNGIYEGHLWVYQDITKQKILDKAIDQQRQFYEDILNNIPVDIAVFDKDHRYLFVNPIAIADPEMRKWIIGKTNQDYCRFRGKDPDALEGRNQLFRSVLEAKVQKEWEEKLTGKTGLPEYYLRKMYPVVDRNGEVNLVIGYGLNITERKKAEEAIHRSEKRYRDLIQYSLALICTHDLEGKLLSVNPAISAAVQYSETEMIGRRISEFMPAEDAVKFDDYLKEILSTGKCEGLFRIISKEGSVIYLLFQNYKMDEFGQDPYIIGFSQDITERVHAEEELKEAKKLTEEVARAKESFLANMSHEIRTPMNGVMGISALLAKTDLNEQQRNYVKLIQESSNNLLVIVNDILDLEKIIMGKLNLEHIAFSVPERVEMCLQSFTFKAEEKGLRLTYRNRLKDAVAVISDPYRLSQVLNNLISNALKFTEHGEVLVETSAEEHEGSRIFIRFSVKDTGIGIPPEKLAEIFEPFVQADVAVSRTHGGTGLGLSICRELIHMMGGVLKVKSEPGKGSEFYFVIPFEISSVLPNSKDDAPKDIDYRSLGARHVLVAEDVELNQFLARHILESWGFTADFAFNGEEAIRKLETNEYDLILMDIQMPVMDGMEATRRIRLLDNPVKAAVPIVALTANALKGDSEKYLKAGMNDYLAKPFTEESLFRVISSSLEPVPLSVKEISYTISKPRIMETSGKPYELSMLEAIAGGDNDFVANMIRLFIDTMPVNLADLKESQLKGDWDTTGKIAHKLKSTIDSMGISSLKQEIRTLENNAKTQTDVESLPGMVDRVIGVINDCIEQLKKDYAL